MNPFDRFGEYMFSLLIAPLKKGKRPLNQFYIFFKVVGTLFDESKQDFFKARRESMIATASTVMLPEHGREREMPRLKGETMDAYRKRLMQKAVIAQKAGTKQGILLMLAALGYESSGIEPFYEIDPERWAEFIIFLRGSEITGINDLDVIDPEVYKVKQASSMPAYAIDGGNFITIRTWIRTGYFGYPICGTIHCGVWPEDAAIGHMVTTIAVMLSEPDSGVHYPPVVGGTLTAEKCYERTYQ